MKTTHSNSRRNFMKFVGASSLFAITPGMAEDTTTPHIVVVGGGFSGATCAKYLKLWGGTSVKVTIIEANQTYSSPILSNLVLNQQRTTPVSFTYGDLSSKYGINMIHKTVSNVDKTTQSLTLDNGETVKYDKLVLATGIDFIESEGAYDYSKVPHAWKAGEQINLLKAQIDDMVDGDTFTMTIPAAPYRCPPGPYERACVVADYLKNVKKLNCIVKVLDANDNITVETKMFAEQFIKHGVVYTSKAKVIAVDGSTKTLTYAINNVPQEPLTSKVLNVIPDQKAAPIVFNAGVDDGRWAPVDPISYESKMASGIYIIGDAQGTKQPKAGHIGNSEAKVCADAILRKLNGFDLYTSPKTNSACYSPTSTTEASWLTAVYEYDSSTQSMVIAYDDVKPKSGPSDVSNYSKMFSWSENLFSDTFA